MSDASNKQQIIENNNKYKSIKKEVNLSSVMKIIIVTTTCATYTAIFKMCISAGITPTLIHIDINKFVMLSISFYCALESQRRSENIPVNTSMLPSINFLRA